MKQRALGPTQGTTTRSAHRGPPRRRGRGPRDVLLLKKQPEVCTGADKGQPSQTHRDTVAPPRPAKTMWGDLAPAAPSCLAGLVLEEALETQKCGAPSSPSQGSPQWEVAWWEVSTTQPGGVGKPVLRGLWRPVGTWISTWQWQDPTFTPPAPVCHTNTSQNRRFE